MFDWSTTHFPNPTVNLGQAAASSVIRSNMDGGHIRQRRRYTANLRTVSVVWELTNEQFKLFQGVHLWKLSAGADWFTIMLPLGQDENLANTTARFTDNGWKAQAFGVMYWRINAQLETEEVSLIDEGTTDGILAELNP